nr:carbamoyltransferase C-terminal domain-containing protein [uncultured Duganella sp.]
MDDGPAVLGINRTQDASACLLSGSTLRWAVQKERLSRVKHHWGRPGDVGDHYAARLPGLDAPIDVLVECYSSDAEIDKLPDYERELAECLTLAPHARRARISHHVAHLYSAFHPSPFNRAAVMVIDGQGSAVADFTEDWGGAAAVPGHWREVASFYLADRERVACLDKQLWERDERHPFGLGMFYFLLTQAMFPGEGNEGKVMGLAPFGDPGALGMPPLEVDGCRVFIPERWRALLSAPGRLRFHHARAGGGDFRDIANLAAAGQHAFEEALLRLARWLHARTGAGHLCFAGGTALNCSVNQRLLRETPFRALFVPPTPGDGGTALGCAVYGLTELAGRPCAWRWHDDYLGPPQEPAAAEAALRGADDLLVERLDDLPALCARMTALLADNKAVALFQGRSEFGPRALGHRSILADPRSVRMRDWINAGVKQREWFRPLAPAVLLERAERYFELTHPAPFMQLAVPVTPHGAERLGATTHVDRSARLQTVGPDGDPLLRALLLAFEARTGVPVLLNTSFNRKDEPIVETPAEALAAFRATPLHALAMPPFLVRKRVEPAAPF